jgi:RNA polymerase sigma factor (sigma-70 family)
VDADEQQRHRAGLRISVVTQVFLESESSLKRFVARFFSRPQDIEEVVQETFLRAFHAEKEVEVRAPKAFLFKIARNLALKELTKKSRLITDYIEDFDGPETLGQEGFGEDHMEMRQKLAAFCHVVASLPPQCRRAFLMRKVYGFSQKEIAERLDISVSTVEKHIASGLMKCSAYMRENGHQISVSIQGNKDARQKDNGRV